MSLTHRNVQPGDHVFLVDGKVNEILDDGCMWNHSEDPNTYSGFQGDWDSSYARRDIQIGEELLDDYGKEKEFY